MESTEERRGISSSNRNFIVGLFFFILVVEGPVDPYGLIIRFAYLLILPGLLWILLKWLGSYWNAGEKENDRLNRAIVTIIAVFIFIGAYKYYRAETHLECTDAVQTRDGIECVRDYEVAPGSDRGTAYILAILGIGAIWYALTDHKKTEGSRS